ncbi:purine permease [Pseudovirgaria hyperparasitica]|uniref:Purine permease n=1 Tax=Pseudovirgaria hyperparasitica TaxID=470096 RepID=A0A6A6WL90_9PEZI|nr:purine permease [Pseudovirgaria hyperparasitica]KAF2762916.1 purine permease [Pseudovirgaria hyperparasitica]
MDHDPDRIGPDMGPKRSMSTKVRGFVKSFTTRDGLIGNYDYAFLFKPNLPFMKKERRTAPFFGLNDKMPLFLALLLGFQHALAMLAGVITPPLILAGSGAANLGTEITQYLVSTALIVCGFLTIIQITRFHIYGTPYYVGTGLISVAGTSFSVIPVLTGAFAQMYENGMCPTDANGVKLPCPDGYGALLGTAACCSLIIILISFMPPVLLKKLFPPLVTGPTVVLIGVRLIQTGFLNWAGGSGTCNTRPETGLYRLCPTINAPHPLPWGSAEFIGLGFSVFVTIIICERFGSPIMKSAAVVIGLLVGCIIAAATGYFDNSSINASPAVSFIWVHTFKLSVYGPAVLPLLAVNIVLAMEAIGDITATCDVSRLEVNGKMYDSRIQGGVCADGLNGILATLCTVTPVSTFAQNNGVISLTRCANRKAGYACCFWLIIMGIFAKFAAALVAIPSAVLGGMTTFLFSAVAVSGMAILHTVPFTRRNRFVLTAAFTLGFGATLVPTWFSYVFTYEGSNSALRGFMDAIALVMESGFAIAGFVACILNLMLAEEVEDEETTDYTGSPLDEERDQEEWERIQRKKGDVEAPPGAQGSGAARSTKEL